MPRSPARASFEEYQTATGVDRKAGEPAAKRGDTRMFRTVLAVTAIAVGITAVAAQSDPIAARKQH